MAYQNPLSGCPPFYHPYASANIAANPQSYLPNQAATVGDHSSLPNYISALNTLHGRVAVLETALAQAMSDKIAAEHAAQYVLKFIAKDRRGSINSSNHEKELKLEREVRAVNAENADLRSQLRKAILLQEGVMRSQGAKYTSNTETGVSPISPTAVSKAPFSVPTTNPTLVDLMDLEDMPDLDFSVGSSTSDDNLEQLNNYVQTPPRIDLVTRVLARSDKHTKLEQNMPHFVRRFVQDSFEESATLASGDHSPYYEQNCTPSDSFVTKHSQIYTGPQAEPANSFLTKILADRIYSKDHHTKPISQSYETGGSETKLDFEVLPEERFVPISETQLHGTRSLKQQPSISNETNLSTTETQPLAPNNGLFGHTNHLGQSFDGATYGPSELFSCPDDRENAIKEHQYSAGFQECRFPDLFRYGIRYEPPVCQTTTFKMVSIMNLPRDMTLNELMSKIRGGTVVSCNLLDTTSITGRFSALVRFLHEHEALAYDDFAAAHPIVFHGVRAHITTIKTPSWPLSLPLSKAIFNHHHTRCLEVVNFPRKITRAHLTRELRSSAVEYMQIRKDGILELRFSSIEHAGRAYGLLTTFRTYRQCGVSFAKDPCALPLDTLIESLERGRDEISDELDHQLNEDEKKNLLACAV
ncbi:hypothetical protein MMC18_006601 [Xylographa bjoerkii]|nr:hypothetical protein [Xylographa bjoerkii]